MRVVFCSDPLRPGRVDPDFEAEANAAAKSGFVVDTMNHEALVRGRVDEAVERIGDRGPSEAVYRGWMMSVPQYAALFEALVRKGTRLVNDPSGYEHCHHLPCSYPVIAARTPAAAWMECGENVPMEAVHELLRPFGTKPVIVKDFVKSRKHEWRDACFIPDATDRAAVERVVSNFLERQGADLAVGLVFREFVELAPIGVHPKSGMPLGAEYRFFVLDGSPIVGADYWDSADSVTPPDFESFRGVVNAVRNRFFTMDVARTRSGNWIILELGDAQVAGLPGDLEPDAFYGALRRHLPFCS